MRIFRTYNDFIPAVIILILVSDIILSLDAAQNRITAYRNYTAGYGDGSGKIYFFRQQSGENINLFSMDETGGNILPLTDDMPGDISAKQSILFSPVKSFGIFHSKTKLAVTKTSGTSDFIYTMNSDGFTAANIYSTESNIDKLRVSPDGNKIAFIETDKNGANSLRIIDAGGSSASSFLLKNNLSAVENISFSPDSSQIAFIDNSLCKVNIDSTNPVDIATGTVKNPCWLSSGKIIFSVNIYQPPFMLASVNPDGSGYAVLYSTTGPCYDYTVSPDETKIAIMIAKYLVIISSSGAVLSEIYLSEYNPWAEDCMSWVSNTKILYSNGKDIRIVNTADSMETNITNNNLEAMNVLFDAAGERIVYRTGGKDIYSILSNGTGQVKILTLSENQNLLFYKLSPDGSKLLYILIDGNNGLLCIRNTDGTGSPVILEPEMDNSPEQEYPKWNSSGTKIIYSKDFVSYYETYIINPDGTDKKSISGSGSLNLGSAFSPDGNNIIFSDGGNWLLPVDISTRTLLSVPTAQVFFYILDWKGDTVFLRRLFTSKKEFWAMDSNGTNIRFLDYGIVEGPPDYTRKISPDGFMLAYTTSTSSCLYIINSSTTEKTKIADNYFSLSFGFNWSLDGNKMAYILTDINIMSSPQSIRWVKLYMADYDGANAVELNPGLYFMSYMPVFLPNNKIAYTGDFDIWVGDYGEAAPPVVFSTNPVMGINPSILDFADIVLGNLKSQTFTITDTAGTGKLTGTISDDRDWIATDRTAFSGNSTTVTVTVNTTGLSRGEYSGTITITPTSGNSGNPQIITVKIRPTCVIPSPNPFIPGAGKKLIFRGTGVPNGTIRIYSLSGELVKTIKEIFGQDELQWDGILDNGNKINSGIYFYAAFNPLEPTGNRGYFTVRK